MEMLKKLKIKFIATIMIILATVFILIIGSINYVNYTSNDMQSMGLLRSLADNDGVMASDGGRAGPSPNPPPGLSLNPSPNIYESEETFSVKIDTSGTLSAVAGDGSISEISEETRVLVDSILESNQTSGSINGYRYLVADKPYGKIIVFLDQQLSNDITDRLLMTSLIIGVISLLVLFFIALFLAKFMVKPVEEAFEKQKRFISDASHELKTPISVISLNADVLEGDIGPNKYLSYIQSEAARMNSLVNNLLTLARLSATENRTLFSEFDLSNAALSIALTFESMAFEENKKYEMDIRNGIRYLGDAEKIKQVIAILIDNAIKNAEDKGLVKVSVKKVEDKIHIEVFNSGPGIPENEQARIFERFYRCDESRSKETGGYGLGLAIAKAIIDEHHGKIRVASETGGWTKFTVIL